PLPSGGCDSAGNYTITDSGASSIPNADTTGLCSFSAGPPSQAICPAANVTLIRVDASGGNDIVVVDALITTTANLLGGDGNDTLTGGLGDDSLQGNLGSDTVSYFNAPARVTVDLGVSTAQDTGGAGMDTISPGVENLTGSAV